MFISAGPTKRSRRSSTVWSLKAMITRPATRRQFTVTQTKAAPGRGDGWPNPPAPPPPGPCLQCSSSRSTGRVCRVAGAGATGHRERERLLSTGNSGPAACLAGRMTQQNTDPGAGRSHRSPTGREGVLLENFVQSCLLDCLDFSEPGTPGRLFLHFAMGAPSRGRRVTACLEPVGGISTGHSAAVTEPRTGGAD